MSPYSQSVGNFPYRLATEHDPRIKSVALSFDDGPNEPYTSQIAEYLDERGIKATFFQVGTCVLRHPETARALLAAGHVIGNHSFSHRFSRCWRARDQLTEIERSQDVFHSVLGIQPTLFRPPWLTRTTNLFDILADHHMSAVSGEFCHAFEPLQPPAQWIARRALAKARPGSILIFHDGYDSKGADRTNTVAAVRTVVDALIARGYHFETVPQLLSTRMTPRLER
jgi:peptidoglycan/xylan/chitin deacetylase (PgdA/CDA1 family)